MVEIISTSHAPPEAIRLMERGESTQGRDERSGSPESPRYRKIPIEEIKAVFNKQNLRRGFSMFDENKDGHIDIRELKRMIRDMGTSIPTQTAQRILSVSDDDNDGFLNYSEFVKMMHNPQFSELFGKYLNTYLNALIPQRNKTRITQRSRDELDSRAADSEPDGKFEEEYSCWPPPITMILISVIEITLFIIDDVYFDSIEGTGPMGLALMYNPHKRFEAWRFITYMFVHIGYMHICFNLIIQILLGISLEMVHRGWRVMIIYLAGVIAGSLLTSLTDPTVFLAGASGGVYALITAHIASVIINWKEMAVPLIQMGIFVVLTVLDFGTAIYSRYYLQEKSQIGYEAHFGGAAAGLLVGIFALRNLEQNSCEKKLWWISLVAFGAFIIVAVIWHIAYPSYFPMQFR